MNLALLKQANDDWNTFVTSLSEAERKGLAELEEAVASNELHYLSTIKDWLTFDQKLNRLSSNYLYNQEIVPTVYNSYIERGLHEAAFGYLNNADQYLKSVQENVNADVQALIGNSISVQLLTNLKQSFGHIRNLQPCDLARIVPDIINNRRVLKEFILNEIVQAAIIVTEKIHGIKQITHEDRYNDLLLAILRLRFPIWGWEIVDQSRTGNSPTGKNAGEVDLLVRAGGNTVTIIEALILTGKDAALTKKHVTKITSYASFLDTYYMVIYYTGSPGGLDHTWQEYKNDVESVAFPVTFKFDKSKGFQSMDASFENVASLRIGRTTHDKTEIFHLMIDLSR